MNRFMISWIGKMNLTVTLDMPRRSVSILHVSADKAKDNYPPLQPYMDFKNTLENVENLNNLKKEIDYRRMSFNINQILENYKKYVTRREIIEKLDKERKEIVQTIKEINLESTDSKSNSKLKNLTEKGKQLKVKFKQVKQKFTIIEDDFIQEFLDLPNTLHTICPTNDKEKLIYESDIPRIEEFQTHLKCTNLVRFDNNGCYYLMDEAAEFDVHCIQALTNYFTQNFEFIQTANPDFVRRVLIEANSTPVDKYHVVVERNLENKLNIAFLAGGASFESFLGAIARIKAFPSALPLRFVCNGRIYERVDFTSALTEMNLFTATQSNAVTTFVASQTATEADQYFEDILNITIEYYKALGIHFKVAYVPAYKLKASEGLRAVIEVYSPAQKRYICVGYLSNYGKYVSKRILFTVEEKGKLDFPYLIGGPVLFTTRLIAALIENKISLENVKLLGRSEYDDVDLSENIEKHGYNLKSEI